MNNNRKMVLYIAQSLDGYIAKEDDDISWLSIVEKENEDYGYKEFIKSIDTVIMGRKTYEIVLSLGIEFLHKDKKYYLLSKTIKKSEDNIEFYGGSIEDLIQKLGTEEGSDIFLEGGAEVIKEFQSRNLIDEYIISIIPILLGRGIRLFKENDNECKLKLIESKSFSTGLVQLKYIREG